MKNIIVNALSVLTIIAVGYGFVIGIDYIMYNKRCEEMPETEMCQLSTIDRILK